MYVYESINEFDNGTFADNRKFSIILYRVHLSLQRILDGKNGKLLPPLLSATLMIATQANMLHLHLYIRLMYSQR